MSVIDPFLDGSQSQGSARGPEGRDLVMLHHDIRGALQGVVGAVAQVDAAALGPENRVQFERIAAASRTLAGLVGAALGEVPDPEAEKARGMVDVGGFLDHVRQRHAGEAQVRGLQLVVEAEEGIPAALRLDAMALARIVDNLVGNAVKFTETGTVRLRVSSEADGAVTFRVADDGPGLPAGALKQVFRYGFRPAESDRAGQGVGLHIVKSLTDRLGGEVSVGNRPAGGVEAVVRFPADVTSGGAAAAGGPEAPDLTGVRVLLAEDNPTNQMVASQMLRSLKAEVTICSDGVEALERFEEEPVDLVVVDIEMPRLSGLDVIRAIRARTDARAHVPIVALTAYAMREHRERIAAAGANGLISKPITSVEALGRGLAAHVARHGRAEAPSPAPEAGDADAEPVIDLVVFQALCDAIGSDVMGELLDKVVADLLGAQRELAGALDTVASEPIRSASHILISVAGALGAVRLQGCARKLNGLAHGDEREPIAEGARRCIAEIDAAVAFARARRAAG
jgi:CheY-like chemotaxis protein